jgi:hypothetical protein
MELTTVGTSPALPVSVLSLLVAAATVVAVILHRFLAIDYDPREPPIIKPRIPYIGHILGIIRHGTKYFDTVK